MSRSIEFKGSSNVKSATLNDDGTTEVTFANGGRATYKNITPDLFEEWEKAESAGRWFHNRVRSKPTEYPMIAQVKDGDSTPVDATPAVPPPLPPAPSGPITGADAGAAIKQANTKIAALQTALEQANARADKAERELELAKVAIQVAKDDARRAGGATRDFRPWRNR